MTEDKNCDQETKQEKIDVSFWPSLEEVEKTYIYLVIKKERGNKSKAAKILGLSYGGLIHKLKKISQETIKQIQE